MASTDPKFTHILIELFEDEGPPRAALIAKDIYTYHILQKFAADHGKINAMKWRKDLFYPERGGNLNNTASTSLSTISSTYAVSKSPVSLQENYISGGIRLDLVVRIKRIALVPCFVVASPPLLFMLSSDYDGGLLSTVLHIESMTPTLSVSYFTPTNNYFHIPSRFFAPFPINLTTAPIRLVHKDTVWGAVAWNVKQISPPPIGGNDVSDIAVGHFSDHVFLMALYTAVSFAPNVCRSPLDPCIMTIDNIINSVTVLEDVLVTEGLDSSQLVDTSRDGSLLIHSLQIKLKFNPCVQQLIQTWNNALFHGFLCDNLATLMSLGTNREEDNCGSVDESTVITFAADDYDIVGLIVGVVSDHFAVPKYGELKSWSIHSDLFGLLDEENDYVTNGGLGSDAMSVLELIDCDDYSNVCNASTSKRPAIGFYLATRLQKYIDYRPVVVDVAITEDSSSPSESNETFACFIGRSDSVEHSCTFKVINRETNQVSYRPYLRKIDLQIDMESIRLHNPWDANEKESVPEVIKFCTSDEFRMQSAVLISTLLFTNHFKLNHPLCHPHCTRVFIGYICSTHGLPMLLLAQHRRIVDTPDIVWGDAAQEDQSSDSNSLIYLLVHLWGVCFGFGFISCQDRSHFTCYDESISIGSVCLLRLYDASHCHQMHAVYVMRTRTNSNHDFEGSVEFKSSVDVVSIIKGLDLVIMLDSLHPGVVIGLALWGAIERSSFAVTTYFKFKFIGVDADVPVPVKQVSHMSMVSRVTCAFVNTYVAHNAITHDFQNNYEMLSGVLSRVTFSLGPFYKLYVDATNVQLKCTNKYTLDQVVKIRFGVRFNDHSFVSSVKFYSCRHIIRFIVVKSRFQCTTNQRITLTCNESYSGKLLNTWGAINKDDIYLNKRSSKWGAVNKINVLSDISCCAVAVDDIHSSAKISNFFDIFAASYNSNVGPIDVGADVNEKVSTLRVVPVSVSMKVSHRDISILSCHHTYTVHFRRVGCHISIGGRAFEDCSTVSVEDRMLVMDVNDSGFLLDGNHRVTTLGTIDLEIVVRHSYGVHFKSDHLQISYNMSEKSLTSGSIISMFLRSQSCWFRVHQFEVVTKWCIVTALLQHWNGIVFRALCTHFLGECCKWLDYGECFRASVSMVTYILVTIVHLWMRLKCNAVSTSDDMRIASWGVSHLSKLGLDTCLLRFVRFGIPF